MTSTALSTLKASQLKHVAFLTGLPSTGTKPLLLSVLNQKLTSPPLSRPARILSIDMGIRNLAYCVLDIPSPTSPSTSTTPPRLTTWQKQDLLTPNTTTTNAFTPTTLSQTAYTLTTSLLTTHNPTHILLERQRFRSGGGAAIQEWTVRVNMLESMIWACLVTLRHQNHEGGPSLHEVSPARVAQFWTAGEGVGLRAEAKALGLGEGRAKGEGKAERRKKVLKKDKIAIARSWVEGKGEDVRLECAGEVSEVFQAGGGGGKLDDLADCLLQAMAWVRWEENADGLRERYGAGPGVSDDTP